MTPPAELDRVQIPRLEEYFGVWAIAGDRFRSLVELVNSIDLTAHVARARMAESSSPAGRAPPYEVIDGVAVIEISGPLMKAQSSLGGTSSVMARRQVRSAAARKDVEGTLLRIESPGGTVAGTAELAEEVFRADLRKPVWTYFEDLGASAAYWVGSQARKVYANATALVGSIGTYAVAVDSSAAAAKEGLEVHVIRAGEFKGAGEPGTKITPEHLAEWQARVDGLNEFFLKGVARGRRLPIERVRELADGRIHLANKAVELGLIDGVLTFDETLAQLSRLTSLTRRAKKMSDENTTVAVLSTIPGPASFQELKDSCTGADAEFLCAQLERKAGLDEARKAWMAEQSKRLAAARKDAEEAKAKAKAEVDEAKAAAKPKPGTEAVGTRNAGAAAEDSDPIARWNELVEAGEAKGLSRAKAISKAAKDHPETHAAYLEAYNAKYRRPSPR